mgnify:CR=1 FL=1
MAFNRRLFIQTAAAATAVSRLSISKSYAAEHKYKIAISIPPAHSIPRALQAAAADILRETNGALDIQVFAGGTLGSDTDTISQVRSGAIEFCCTAGLVWGTLVPTASLSVVAFAFPDYDAVWKAMDGDLGGHIREGFSKVGLVPQPKIFDYGFRHITTAAKRIETPADLSGAKIRVPVSPMLLSLFKALGAAPASMNFSELYTALQTKIVDGQENPLALVETAKLYEVQKNCAMTYHAWDGFWLVANRRAWNALPANLREIASKQFEQHATRQRAENAALEATLVDGLKARGMVFNSVDGGKFRQALQKADFYKSAKDKFGSEAWKIFEKYAGKLT